MSPPPASPPPLPIWQGPLPRPHPFFNVFARRILQRRGLPPVSDPDDTDEDEDTAFYEMSRETVVLRYLHARYPKVRRGNPRYNPNTVNIAAINRFNQNTGRIRTTILPSDVEIYHRPESNVRLFHAHFPLGRFFNKVNNGARIFLTTRSTRNNRPTQKSPAMDIILKF